ncbi:MAG: GGDEF domain-containing protein [Gemmatimonadota bacterium]
MGNIVLIAKSPWPLLRRAGALLSSAGYGVVEVPAWNRLLDNGVSCPDLSGVLLGEHGDTDGEVEILRRFRARTGALGVPVVLVGGLNAMYRAERFRAAGADVVLPADIPEEEFLAQIRPLLRYGALYQEIASSNKEFREQSLRDSLTGLPNRKHFSLDLARHVEMARRIGRPLSCILMDIDDFKAVNDTYGREAGDGVIRQFGEIVDGAKRTYDTVARLGGDEFGWLLIDADPRQALQAAGRVRDIVLRSPFRTGTGAITLSATFGVSSLVPGMELRADDLVGNADRALYWGKESGKNAVRFYPPEKAKKNGANDPDIS